MFTKFLAYESVRNAENSTVSHYVDGVVLYVQSIFCNQQIFLKGLERSLSDATLKYWKSKQSELFPYVLTRKEQNNESQR